MKLKTWAVYDKNNHGVGTVEAGSESAALNKFAKENNIPDNELDGYWVEELDA